MTKQVTVLATYTFKNSNRVCFTVLSSDKVTKYNCCFNGTASSCNCPARGECYHITQLAPRAAALLGSATKVEVTAPVKVETSKTRRSAPLNDRNQGFSLMR